MITCKLYGRLGNQMFQISTTIAHALDNGYDYIFPYNTENSIEWTNYHHNFNVKTTNLTLTLRQYNEIQINKYNKIPNIDNICLNGYFQSYKYFDNHRDILRDIFLFDKSKKLKYTSIHVRRGDYLLYPDKHPVISLEYINEAMSLLPKNTKYLVFSDDILWCKNNIKGKNVDYSEVGNAIDDLKNMSYCENNIIANSSYSWWAAYMNNNKNKKVICPNKWFGIGNAHITTIDMFPDTWIKI